MAQYASRAQQRRFCGKAPEGTAQSIQTGKMKHYLRNFRIIPSINMNPMTDELSVSFQPSTDNGTTAIEDVLNTIQKVSTPQNKLIVVFDEFQSILEIDKTWISSSVPSCRNRQASITSFWAARNRWWQISLNVWSLRSIIWNADETQQDSIRRFQIIYCRQIERCIRAAYSNCRRDTGLYKLPSILHATAFIRSLEQPGSWQNEDVLQLAIEDIITTHDLDYERLWLNFNKTDKYVMVSICEGNNPAQDRNQPTSTMTSALLRLSKKGYIIRSDRYEIEDPFFRKWILKNMIE